MATFRRKLSKGENRQGKIRQFFNVVYSMENFVDEFCKIDITQHPDFPSGHPP